MLKMKTVFWVGLVALLGAGAFALAFGSLDRGIDRGESYSVYAILDDATGLVEGSRVMLSGIAVGEIDTIGLDTEQPDKARVTILVKDDLKLHEGIEEPTTGRWRNGATVLRKQASLLGDYYISLTPGVAGRVLGDGDRVRNVVTESGLGAIMKQVEQSTSVIFPRLEKITHDIENITGTLDDTLGGEEGREAIADVRDDVRRTVENVAAVSDELRAFMASDVTSQGENIAAILQNVRATTEDLRRISDRSSGHVDAILGNVDRLTADLRRFVGDQTAPAGKAHSGTLSKSLAKLDRNMALVEGTLENVQSVTEKIDQGKGTIGRLVNDDKLINRFDRIASDVSDFTGSYAATKVDVNIRSEYLFGQGALKHYVTIRLRPKPDKFYILQLVDDPRGRVRTYQRVTTSNDPSKPVLLTEDVSTTTSDFKITAQLAKRWKFLTFRYGVMESTGGWGVDADLLEDALRFKLDVFNFNFERLPRVRLLAAWEFTRYVYVAAGIDDVLNQGGRDYFVGAGVRFTDDDIKSVLPMIPKL